MTTQQSSQEYVIATRAMTDEERVQLLLDAVRRVLIELPEKWNWSAEDTPDRFRGRRRQPEHR